MVALGKVDTAKPNAAPGDHNPEARGGLWYSPQDIGVEPYKEGVFYGKCFGKCLASRAFSPVNTLDVLRLHSWRPSQLFRQAFIVRSRAS